jgi:hypothetical protein
VKEAGIRVNAPQVIHESIDGEVIIINLASGNYYSLKGSGAEVWDVIQATSGLSPQELVEQLAPRFDISASELEEQVSGFLDELKQEGLTAEASPSERVAPPVGAERAGILKGPFQAPALEKFTDMQELVLLDPVHEVDATGWPQPRPDDAPVSSQGA